MYWIGVWLGEDQERTPSRHMLKEIELHFQSILTTLHSITNTIGKICVFNSEINKDVVLITITKSKKV